MRPWGRALMAGIGACIKETAGGHLLFTHEDSENISPETKSPGTMTCTFQPPELRNKQLLFKATPPGASWQSSQSRIRWIPKPKLQHSSRGAKPIRNKDNTGNWRGPGKKPDQRGIRDREKPDQRGIRKGRTAQSEKVSHLNIVSGNGKRIKAVLKTITGQMDSLLGCLQLGVR